MQGEIVNPITLGNLFGFWGTVILRIAATLWRN